jgi:hypothetical protein
VWVHENTQQRRAHAPSPMTTRMGYLLLKRNTISCIVTRTAATAVAQHTCTQAVPESNGSGQGNPHPVPQRHRQALLEDPLAACLSVLVVACIGAELQQPPRPQDLNDMRFSQTLT